MGNYQDHSKGICLLKKFDNHKGSATRKSHLAKKILKSRFLDFKPEISQLVLGLPSVSRLSSFTVKLQPQVVETS